MPGILSTRAQFGRLFDSKADPLARRRLAARVRPFLLRRTKSQVATDLPERVEEDLLCELEGEQKLLYRAELKRAQQMLLKVKTENSLDKHRFNFLTSLLRLRQICCHPALVHETIRSACCRGIEVPDVELVVVWKKAGKGDRQRQWFARRERVDRHRQLHQSCRQERASD